jgi:hypothetical protein
VWCSCSTTVVRQVDCPNDACHNTSSQLQCRLCCEFTGNGVCGACLGMVQGWSVFCARGCVDGVRELLRVVARSDGAGLLEQQLLCGKTSQLMARVLDGMLATVQVPTPPNPRIHCFSAYSSRPKTPCTERLLSLSSAVYPAGGRTTPA